MIHKDSKISWEIYKRLFNIEIYESNYGMPIFRVDEKYIDNARAARNFSEILGPYFKCVTANDMDAISIDTYDAVINCTNNQWVPIPLPFTPSYEVFCSFVYKIDFKVPTAFTIMDGEYFSIYPYDLDRNYYTLTHVKYGVVSRSDNLTLGSTDIQNEEKRRVECERNVFELLPFLRGKMEYVTRFLSYKTKYDFINDDRSLRVFRDGRYFSFSGGKITGIFDVEPFLEEILVCCQTGERSSCSLSSPTNSTLNNPMTLDSQRYGVPEVAIPDSNGQDLEN